MKNIHDLCELGQLCTTSLYNWSRAPNRVPHFRYLNLAHEHVSPEQKRALLDTSVSVQQWASELGLASAFELEGISPATVRSWVSGGLECRAKALLLGYQQCLLGQLATAALGEGQSVNDLTPLVPISQAELVGLYQKDSGALAILIRSLSRRL